MTARPALAETPLPPPSCELGWPQRIPQSGALLGRPDWGIPADEVFAAIEGVTVRWDDGTAVAGVLEVVHLGEDAGSPQLLWRPDAPLDRTGVLEVEVVFDDTQGGGCYAENPTPTDAVEVVADPVDPFVPPPVGPLVGVFELTQLVCCDGAMPTVPTVEFSVRGDLVSWEQGDCVLPQALTPGNARLDVEVPNTDLPGLWVARVMDGETTLTQDVLGQPLYFEYEAPFIATIELFDLASGERLPLAGDIAVPGEVAVDVIDPDDAVAELGARCEGEPYQCGVDHDADQSSWSAASCSPWIDEDGGGSSGGPATTPETQPPASEGCGCTTSDDRGTGVLTASLVMLGALRRRRSRAT